MMRVREHWAASVFGFLLLVPVPATGGTITGRVYLSGDSRGRVLVSVEGIRALPAGAPATAYLDHVGQKFVPELVPILVGTRVEFRSQGMPCRLFSLSAGGAFNLMRQADPVKWLRFERPGVIQVLCQDHPSAYAYIVVKENPYFALTDDSGEYRIGGVPGGQRTVQVWFDGRKLAEKSVTIVEEESRLDFHLDQLSNEQENNQENNKEESNNEAQ